jgi:hypothetical protein
MRSVLVVKFRMDVSVDDISPVGAIFLGMLVGTLFNYDCQSSFHFLGASK